MKLVYAIVNSDDTYAVNKEPQSFLQQAVFLCQETPPFLSAALMSR